MKTLFSLAACLFTLILTPPLLDDDAHNSYGRLPHARLFCPSFDPFHRCSLLSPDSFGGGSIDGARPLTVWAGDNHGCDDGGDWLSSSRVPPNSELNANSKVAGLDDLTHERVESKFGEAEEGAPHRYGLVGRCGKSLAAVEHSELYGGDGCPVDIGGPTKAHRGDLRWVSRSIWLTMLLGCDRTQVLTRFWVTSMAGLPSLWLYDR